MTDAERAEALLFLILKDFAVDMEDVKEKIKTFKVLGHYGLLPKTEEPTVEQLH